jgi:hypothetical protein
MGVGTRPACFAATCVHVLYGGEGARTGGWGSTVGPARVGEEGGARLDLDQVQIPPSVFMVIKLR